MRIAPDTVGDHRRKVQLRIERLEPEHDGGRATGLSLDIDHQDDRGAQPLRHLGSRRLVTGGVEPVEAAHDTLDDRQINVGGMAGDRREHMIAPAHPSIEIVGAAAGDDLVEPGVDEVGADLETLDGKPTTSERFQQAKCDGGFTHPARYARDHQKARRLHERTLPSADSGCKGRGPRAPPVHPSETGNR